MPLYLDHGLVNGQFAKLYNEKKLKYEEKRLSFPFEIRHVDSELNKKILGDFKGERTGFIQVGPKNYFFPSGYEKEAENFYNFELRPDDVFVATFPRSGTTWTQDMVWLLCNNLDYDKAAEIPLIERFPFLEFSCFVHKEAKAEFLEENKADPEKYKTVQELDYPGWKALAKTDEQRFIKTHLPFSLLPPNLTKSGCKVIYVARNPKDVAVSFYHLNRTMRTQGYSGDFEKYWGYFQNNLQPWTPYWEHIKEGWNVRHEENVLFIFYEEMNKNLRAYIEKVATFLGKCYTSEELDLLENHLKFENFRNNKSVNFDVMENIGVYRKVNQVEYVRNGKNGGWRDYFNQEMEKQADQWIEENLKDTDLRFPL